jgi:CheY-like chemotaxis protein
MTYFTRVVITAARDAIQEHPRKADALRRHSGARCAQARAATDERFRIHLRHAPDHDPRPRPYARRTQGAATMVDILILNPDAPTRAMLTMLFTTVGYTVAQADNGVDGLTLVQAQMPRVVLAALELPRLDGLLFARRLQQLPGIRLPHLFLTSDGVPTHVPAVGQHAIMTKLFDLEDVLAQVIQVAPPHDRWAG